MTDTFYPDISKYQHVIGPDFAYSILCFRLDSGYETDPNASANLKVALANPRVKLLIGYVVPIPGHNDQILGRVKKLLGGKCPPNMGFMLDEESGRGFAGPGDHSTEWNALDAELGAFAGSSKRVIGYANTGDWSSGWPHHRPDLKRVVAKYSPTPPSISYYGWQYSDGSTQWPVPSGYPRTSTDMNVIHKPIDEILADFGVTDTGEDMPLTDVDAEKVAEKVWEFQIQNAVDPATGKPTYAQARQFLTWEVGQIKAAAQVQNAVKAAVAQLNLAGVDPDALAKAVVEHMDINVQAK